MTRRQVTQSTVLHGNKINGFSAQKDNPEENRNTIRSQMLFQPNTLA